MIDLDARIAVPAARFEIPRWTWFALLALLLLPRLWRLDAVGEGTDEGFSVAATRAMLRGEFSYAELNDFSSDGYQAKFCPVAEAVAVPFVAVLGDHAWAFRLPSFLASLLLALLVTRAAFLRFGPLAGAIALAFFALDYRTIVYAQTHRYVAVEQLLAFLLAQAIVRAEITSRWRDAGIALVVGLLLFHTHLLAVLAIGPLWLAVKSPEETGPFWRSRSRAHWTLLALLAYALAVLLLFRSMAIGKFFDAGTLGEGISRAFSRTFRALASMGIAPAVLGSVSAVALIFFRRKEIRCRAWAYAAVLPVFGFFLLSIRYRLEPRYVLAAQPFLILCAAALASKLLGWTFGRGRLRVAAALLILSLPTLYATGWYLATGGGRDAEAPVLEALEANASPKDAALLDIPHMDPFGRRPKGRAFVGRNVTLDPKGESRLDEEHVRFIVRSTLEPTGPIYTPSLLSRMEPVRSWQPPALFQTPWTITLYRVKPR